MTTQGRAARKELAACGKYRTMLPIGGQIPMHLPQQASNSTRMDRYPAIFRVAKAAAGSEPTRILSYGCSTGEEPLTLARKYFPNAQILGVDISDEALEQARVRTANTHNVRIARSSESTISEFGPYDIIFAMSVLCRNPPPRDHRWDEFPFAAFEETVASLIAPLKAGGVLVLANANYILTQSRLIRHFDLVTDARMRDPGQVWKLASDGTVLERPATKDSGTQIGTACIFRKRAEPWPDGPHIPLRIVASNGTELVTIWLDCRG
jgi:SAM-dependent methyltransferase